MSPPNLNLIEPHPSVPRTSRLQTGRGGAGNFISLSSASPITHGPTATGPASASRTLTSTTTSTTPTTPRPQPPSSLSFSSSSTPDPAASRRPGQVHIGGRGGAGNVRPAAERRMFSFEEEMRREERAGSVAATAVDGGRRGSGAAVVVHFGRGGAGNKVVEGVARGSVSSFGSGRSSVSSEGEGGFGRRLGRWLSRE